MENVMTIQTNRLTDTHRTPDTGKPLPLPIIDWKRIGYSAPVPITGVYDGSSAPLPKADVAVMTWTSAEWNAFDHVFLNSSSTRYPDDRDWEHAWHTYSRNVPKGMTTDNTSAPLWGLYRLVDVPTKAKKTLRVLLFKCDTHLAHPPYIQGLQQITQQILDETGCTWIWSIGTAGGSRETENLGDVVIANAGTIQLKLPQNLKSGLNNKTIKGTAFPSTKLFATVQKHLFFDMATVVTWPALESMLDQLHQKDPSSAKLTLGDLVNAPLNPANLRQSRILPMDGDPLLTTDYYYIAQGNDAAKYAVLEMDDAVIGYVAQQKERRFAFARNISDPIVAGKAKGKAIDPSIREDWSGEIYQRFGFYTSFNGALATWAALTAM
jgi:nucleoside phosphorylase